jgi:hypothetical protein
VRANVARYINHACKPNAESDVKPRKRKVVIRAIKNIEPGDEINYDYGTDYFKAYLKPIGCKCDACEKKRKKKRAEARAERLRLRAKEEKKAERKARKEAEKRAAERAKARKAKEKAKDKAGKAKVELKPDRKRKLDSKSKTPTVRAKTASRPVKRKVASGVRANVAGSPRREINAAAAETSITFATPNEAQQASG